MPLKFFAILIGLLGLLSFALAQQTFESKGRNYHAKVVLHRQNVGNRPPINSPRKGYAYTQPKRFGPKRPWRQGDRITKQEVIQNMVKALLDRKAFKKEKENEQKQKNAEALKEYALVQAKLAKDMRRAQAPKRRRYRKKPQVRKYQQPSRHPNVAANEIEDSWKLQGKKSSKYYGQIKQLTQK